MRGYRDYLDEPRKISDRVKRGIQTSEKCIFMHRYVYNEQIVVALIALLALSVEYQKVMETVR